MGFAITLAVLLIAGAVVAVVAQRRSAGQPAPLSGLDAEAEANHWLVRLGGSLSAIDVRAQEGADRTAAQALTEASERLRAGRRQLAGARTAAEYAEVTRTAVEGLRHVCTARMALGLDEGSAAAQPDRTAISSPLDQASRVVRKPGRSSSAASSCSTAVS
jgi:hypothetical protein